MSTAHMKIQILPNFICSKSTWYGFWFNLSQMKHIRQRKKCKNYFSCTSFSLIELMWRRVNSAGFCCNVGKKYTHLLYELQSILHIFHSCLVHFFFTSALERCQRGKHLLYATWINIFFVEINFKLLYFSPFFLHSAALGEIKWINNKISLETVLLWFVFDVAINSNK